MEKLTNMEILKSFSLLIYLSNHIKSFAECLSFRNKIGETIITIALWFLVLWIGLANIPYIQQGILTYFPNKQMPFLFLGLIPWGIAYPLYGLLFTLSVIIVTTFVCWRLYRKKQMYNQ